MNLLFFLLFLSFFINIRTSTEKEKSSSFVDLNLVIRFPSSNMYDVLNIKKNELGFSLATLTELEVATSFLKYHQENTKNLNVPSISDCILNDIRKLSPFHHTFMDYIPFFSKAILSFQEYLYSLKYDPQNINEIKHDELQSQIYQFQSKLKTNFHFLHEQMKNTLSFTSSWVKCFPIPPMVNDSHRFNAFFEKFQRLIFIMMLESSKPILWKRFPTLSSIIENKKTDSPFLNPDFFFITQGLKISNIYFEKDTTPHTIIYNGKYQALVFPIDMLTNQNALTSSFEFLDSFFLNTDMYRRSLKLWNTYPSTTLLSFRNILSDILNYLTPIYTELIELPTIQGKEQRISIFKLGKDAGKNLKVRLSKIFKRKEATREFPFLEIKNDDDIHPLFGKQFREMLPFFILVRSLFDFTTTSMHVNPPVNFWSSSSHILSKHMNINYPPPTHGELIQAYHTQENTAATTTSNTKQETLSKEGQTEKESKVDLGLGTSQQASLRTPPQPIESDETRKRKEQNVETLATHVPEVKRFRQDQPNQVHVSIPTRPLEVVPPAPSLHSHPLVSASSSSSANEPSTIQEDATYDGSWLDHLDLDHRDLDLFDLDYLPPTEPNEDTNAQTMEVMNNDWLNAFEHEFSSSAERNVHSNAQNVEGSHTHDLGLPLLREDEVSATRNRYFEYVEDANWEKKIDSVNLLPRQHGILENPEAFLNDDRLDDHRVMESRSSIPYDIQQPIPYFVDLASISNEGLSEVESYLSTPLDPYSF